MATRQHHGRLESAPGRSESDGRPRCCPVDVPASVLLRGLAVAAAERAPQSTSCRPAGGSWRHGQRSERPHETANGARCNPSHSRDNPNGARWGGAYLSCQLVVVRRFDRASRATLAGQSLAQIARGGTVRSSRCMARACHRRRRCGIGRQVPCLARRQHRGRARSVWLACHRARAGRPVTSRRPHRFAPRATDRGNPSRGPQRTDARAVGMRRRGEFRWACTAVPRRLRHPRPRHAVAPRGASRAQHRRASSRGGGVTHRISRKPTHNQPTAPEFRGLSG